jgi:hypothetical protein
MQSDDRDMDQGRSTGDADGRELRLEAHDMWQPFQGSYVVFRESRSPTGGPYAPLQRPCSMSEKERPKKPASKRSSPLEASFDRYLSRQLHEIYDPILDEAIPDSIAKLLDQFGEKPAKPSSSGGGKDVGEG